MDSPRAYDFFVEADKYVLHDVGSTAGERPLVIDRVTHAVSLSDYDISFYESAMPQPKKIYGILGSIRLLSGRYLMTVDKCELVGSLFGHQIFKVTATSLHPFAKSLSHLNATEMVAETAYINMLTFMLQMEGMYFSNTYDLTVSQQRLSDFGPEYKHMSIFERAEKQFLWNNVHLQDWFEVLTEIAKTSLFPFNASNYLTPIILGFVGIVKASVSFESTCTVASYAIISRRSVKRAGTRYFARGLDSNADPANFVETEQLVYLPPSHVYSFVQIRGSVPLYWTQRPTLKYKPEIKIGLATSGTFGHSPYCDPQSLADVEPNQKSIIRRHFIDLCYLHHYGRVVAVNLLDHTGIERPLGQLYALASQVVDQQDLKYVEFDFHKECRALRWDRLQILIDRLDPELMNMGQLRLLTPSGRESLQDATVLSRQSGVFRTNCIDCLDRTNVLQSMLAKCALVNALRDTGTTSTTSTAEAELWPGFGMVFKELWADHADVLSLQYSGTPALKTDFTRTGKRTFKGILMDGYNSLLRYYLNNFVDGFRQDAFNLYLGNYEIFNSVDKRAKLPLPKGPPLNDVKIIRRRFLPMFSAFSTSLSVLSLLFPSVGWISRLIYFIFWGLASVFSAATILSHGDEFVNMPCFPME